MNFWPTNYFHQSASNSSTTVGAGVGSDIRLVSVVVGTGAASGVVTVRDGDTSGAIVAVIAAASASNNWFGGVRMTTGKLTVVTSGGAADVTVTYI